MTDREYAVLGAVYGRIIGLERSQMHMLRLSYINFSLITALLVGFLAHLA